MSAILRWLSEREVATGTLPEDAREDPKPAVERLVEDIHEDARRREAEARERERRRLFDLD